MAATQRRPNIIFFFTDQQRADTVGCYGSPMGLTPNLDAMAEEGVRFELAFTAQPVCGPARSLLQSGLYPTSTGCFRNGIALPLETRTIAHQMRDAGYEVGYIGKWHLASTHGLPDEPEVDYQTKPVPPERRGGYDDYWLAADILEFTSSPYGGGYFDGDGEFVPFDGYRVDSQTDHVLEYLRTRDGAKPFFLFLSYLEPHHQNDLNRYVAPYGYAERYEEYPVPGDLIGQEGGDWQENLPDYYGICASIDENLGRLRAELARLGLSDDTLILYTTDHGSHFRTRNSEYKRSCHEASIRLPMVACGPGCQGGNVIDDLVSLVDVPPTLLEWAGIEAPAHYHGRSLQPLVDGTAVDWPEEVFVQISESQVGRAIRTKRWKYCIDAPDKNGGRDADSPRYVEQYLYDLDADPHERTNLVGDPAYRQIADGLAERLIERMVAAGERAPEIVKA